MYAGRENYRLEVEKELVLTDFATSAPEFEKFRNIFGEVPRLSTAESSVWQCETEGTEITCENRVTEKKYCLAMSSSAVYWNISNAVQLGGDLVVFQLGYDQICLLHIPTKRLALIARGRSPLVVEPK